MAAAAKAGFSSGLWRPNFGLGDGRYSSGAPASSGFSRQLGRLPAGTPRKQSVVAETYSNRINVWISAARGVQDNQIGSKRIASSRPVVIEADECRALHCCLVDSDDVDELDLPRSASELTRASAARTARLQLQETAEHMDSVTGRKVAHLTFLEEPIMQYLTWDDGFVGVDAGTGCQNLRHFDYNDELYKNSSRQDKHDAAYADGHHTAVGPTGAAPSRPTTRLTPGTIYQPRDAVEDSVTDPSANLALLPARINAATSSDSRCKPSSTLSGQSAIVGVSLPVVGPHRRQDLYRNAGNPPTGWRAATDQSHPSDFPSHVWNKLQVVKRHFPKSSSSEESSSTSTSLGSTHNTPAPSASHRRRNSCSGRARVRCFYGHSDATSTHRAASFPHHLVDVVHASPPPPATHNHHRANTAAVPPTASCHTRPLAAYPPDGGGATGSKSTSRMPSHRRLASVRRPDSPSQAITQRSYYSQTRSGEAQGVNAQQGDSTTSTTADRSRASTPSRRPRPRTGLTRPFFRAAPTMSTWALDQTAINEKFGEVRRRMIPTDQSNAADGAPKKTMKSSDGNYHSSRENSVKHVPTSSDAYSARAAADLPSSMAWQRASPRDSFVKQTSIRFHGPVSGKVIGLVPPSTEGGRGGLASPVVHHGSSWGRGITANFGQQHSYCGSQPTSEFCYFTQSRTPRNTSIGSSWSKNATPVMTSAGGGDAPAPKHPKLVISRPSIKASDEDVLSQSTQSIGANLRAADFLDSISEEWAQGCSHNRRLLFGRTSCDDSHQPTSHDHCYSQHKLNANRREGGRGGNATDGDDNNNAAFSTSPVDGRRRLFPSQYISHSSTNGGNGASDHCLPIPRPRQDIVGSTAGRHHQHVYLPRTKKADSINYDTDAAAVSSRITLAADTTALTVKGGNNLTLPIPSRNPNADHHQNGPCTEGATAASIPESSGLILSGDAALRPDTRPLAALIVFDAGVGCSLIIKHQGALVCKAGFTLSIRAYKGGETRRRHSRKMHGTAVVVTRNQQSKVYQVCDLRLIDVRSHCTESLRLAHPELRWLGDQPPDRPVHRRSSMRRTNSGIERSPLPPFVICYFENHTLPIAAQFSCAPDRQSFVCLLNTLYNRERKRLSALPQLSVQS